MRARSRRIAALTSIMVVPALFSACTDTAPTGVALHHPTAAAPPRRVSASVQLGEGALVFGTASSANALQSALEAMGKTVTRSPTLPADLRPYKTIWFVDKTTPLTTDDVPLLGWFLDQGGGVYLSGEGNCCDAVSRSVGWVVSAVVTYGGSIQVGSLGDAVVPWPFESHYALDIRPFEGPVPFGMSEWAPDEPGRMEWVQSDDVLARLTSDGSIVGAAWDWPTLEGKFGRLVVMMDADWFNRLSARSNLNLLKNISYFLDNARVPNHAPAASARGPSAAIEGVAVALSAMNSWDAEDGDALSYAWDLDLDGQYDDAFTGNVQYSFPDDGSYTVAVRVTDSQGWSSTASHQVTVSNRNPTMTFSAPASVVEGAVISLGASTLGDAPADLPTLAVTYSCDGGTTFGTTASCPAVDGPATVKVVGRVTDKDGGSTDYPSDVTVTNAAPAIASLTLPITPVAVGTPVSLAATFSDDWVNDGHTASIDWDDASTSSGTVGGAVNPRSVSASHTYATPGVYAVALTVKDDAAEQDVEVHQYVVVYDPSAGFVTGGGWIAYGATACPVLCVGASGRGEFGFVSKYVKGTTVPSGDTRFEFHAGTLKFESTSYEWLVVAGGRAQFKGRGTIGGGGDYGFLVTAVDGSTDAFRIKIWNRATSAIVFDNQMDADDNSPAATLLDKVSGNGSIVIRVK